MTTADWAAWVQAIGSIAAIVAGFATVYFQNRTAEKLREGDRTDRAEVVAFRLSGWLAEVGTVIKVKSEIYNRLVWDTLPQTGQIASQWKLNVASGVEPMMPELHYLKVGTRDVAQLEFQVPFFDAFLDKLISDPSSRSQENLRGLYKSVGAQLKQMQGLQANAERHVNPIIQAAIEKDR